MSFIGNAIGSLTGANQQAKAASDAANLQYQASKDASALQKQMFDQTRQDLNPYMNAGTSALGQMMGKMAPEGYFNQTYTGQDIYKDPSYQFRLNQGLDAVQQGAAAQGGLLSGATLKALNDYGQQSASQEYGNAYNRFNADQTNRFNRLNTIVGMGQNAAAGVGNSGMQTAQAMANNTMAGADAMSAGRVAQGNAQASNMQNLLGIGGAVAKLFI